MDVCPPSLFDHFTALFYGMSKWLIIGGGLMYLSILFALLWTARSYRFPSILVLTELAGYVISCIGLPSGLVDLMMVLGTGALLFIYLWSWVGFAAERMFQGWKFGRDLETYRMESLLGLATIYFHFDKNRSTTVNLLYMIYGPPLLFAGVVAMNLPDYAFHVGIAFLASIFALSVAAARSLDKGYLRLHYSRKMQGQGSGP